MPTFERARAETMPLVTVWPTPNGSPMASTRSPTCGRVAGRQRHAPAAARRRRRSSGPPRRRAGRRAAPWPGTRGGRPATTMMSWPPAMTWLLVTITPSARTMTPEPSDWAIARAAGLAAAEHLEEGIDLLAHDAARIDVDHGRRGLAHHWARRRGRIWPASAGTSCADRGAAAASGRQRSGRKTGVGATSRVSAEGVFVASYSAELSGAMMARPLRPSGRESELSGWHVAVSTGRA